MVPRAPHLLAACLFALLSPATALAQPPPPPPRPNLIIIFTDDQGFQDIGCFGSPQIKTPRLDQMAAEGLRLDNFYVGASVCSASRASLLTGRYPHHHGTGGVYFPEHDGMDLGETTVAQVLRGAGYATAAIGKWHLGDRGDFHPIARGFDRYFGISYSNDMYLGPGQVFAADCTFLAGWDRSRAEADLQLVSTRPFDRATIRTHQLSHRVPLLRDREIVEYPADQTTLTRRYFDHAIDFVAARGDRPFFIYLAPAMPHIPLFASADFDGRSARGPYGDTIEEIDWNVGRLLDALAAAGVDDHTLVIFTSDNGPWLDQGDAGGSAAPLRDGKFSIYEGGLRVPAILRWPGHIPAGRLSREIVSTIDLLPTFAGFAGAALPTRPLDGIDLRPFLADPSLPSGRDTFLYVQRGRISGLRWGDWKYLPLGGSRQATDDDSPELYHLAHDVAESTNLAATEPARLAMMQARLDAFLAELKATADL